MTRSRTVCSTMANVVSSEIAQFGHNKKAKQAAPAQAARGDVPSSRCGAIAQATSSALVRAAVSSSVAGCAERHKAVKEVYSVRNRQAKTVNLNFPDQTAFATVVAMAISSKYLLSHPDPGI